MTSQPDMDTENQSGRRKRLPSKADILAYMKDQTEQVGKREIARAFGIRGNDKIWLKAILKELAADGEVLRTRGRRIVAKDQLPEVVLIDLTGIDRDGELIGKPANWTSDDPPPRIIMVQSGRGQPALAPGDRVLARVKSLKRGLYQGRLIRRLQAAPEQIVGVYRRQGQEGRIEVADKRQRDELIVEQDHANGAQTGDVILAEALPGRSFGLRRARVTEKLGRLGDPSTFSMIAVQQHGIPTRFEDEALAEAAKARPVRLGQREDLTALPLLTIDPADARDHDDAVFAEPDSSPEFEDGWHVVVAIADVSWYVRPGSALDREARRRGNSVYFPDHVVPMLPEALSADLCSLLPNKTRAAIAVHMWFDRDGNKRKHRFCRALIRSPASLEYRQVQRAIDGAPDEACAPFMKNAIEPLFGAYRTLAKARERRQPLAIELPERRIEFGEDGFIKSVHQRERFEAHRLIEEFMIMANVAAAETLEAQHQPCMYRIHEPPALEKTEALRQFLETMSLHLPKGQTLKPFHFNRILASAADQPFAQLVNETVLRSQSQALYSAENLGHFGLNLSRYAHFTSPIRRYADLLVHRALISGGHFGEGGLSDTDRAQFDATAAMISAAERRAMLAERDALDRFTAAFLSDRVGATFIGHIAGVTRFGLFVKLIDTGADGIIPISSLGGDYYRYDEARHALIGERSRIQYQLGDRVEVRLLEAAPVSGGLRFALLPGQGQKTTRKEKLSSRREKPRRKRR